MASDSPILMHFSDSLPRVLKVYAVSLIFLELVLLDFDILNMGLWWLYCYISFLFLSLGLLKDSRSPLVTDSSVKHFLGMR
jgi:hypothetical protein